MSYRIIFKGQIEDKYVDDARGSALAAKWKNEELFGRIDIDGDIFEASTIKAILGRSANPDSQDAKTLWVERMKKEQLEHEAWKRELLAKSPEERAKSTAFFNYLSQAIRGRPLTEEEKLDVQKAQQRFFEENPTFHQANPTCYFTREEIQKRQMHFDRNGRVGMPKTAGELLASNVLQYAERHLNA